MNPLIDQHGRAITSLRVSVTDRCNLRCQYCMPAKGSSFCSTSRILTFEEVVRVVRVAASLGVKNIRITGGEPLLRKNLFVLIRQIKTQTTIKDVSLTTNALLLAEQVSELKAAGLDRISVSCDSLVPERFHKITRFARLERVWTGIRKAQEVGIRPIRINTLLLKGFNEDEVSNWIELTRREKIDVRFMELMPIGEGIGHLGSFLNVAMIRDEVINQYNLQPAFPNIGNGPAKYWKLPDGKGLIGFITAISDNYCDSCSRMRLVSTGLLRPCLASNEEISILSAVRAKDDVAIRSGLRLAAAIKSKGHHWDKGHSTRVEMSALGG